MAGPYFAYFILILYTWFSCVKIIQSCNVGLSGLALKSNNSNCLVLVPHRQLGNYRIVLHMMIKNFPTRQSFRLQPTLFKDLLAELSVIDLHFQSFPVGW